MRDDRCPIPALAAMAYMVTAGLALGAPARAPTEHAPCRLRHQAWIVPPVDGGPRVALEIVARGGFLVPVVSVAGLPTAAAVVGTLGMGAAVDLALDGAPPVTLRCGLSGDGRIACAPDAAAAAALAKALPRANTIAVSLTVPITGAQPLRSPGVTLRLTGIEAALTRLRALGTTEEALPSYPGLDLWGFAGRVMRDSGVPESLPRTGP
jgi:hypothetical protein